MDYHDDVEEAQEAAANPESTLDEDKKDEKLLDIENEPKDTLIHLDTATNSSRNGIVYNSSTENSKSLEEFFGNLNLDQEVFNRDKQSVNKTEETDQSEFSKSSEERKLVMDIFGECNTDFNLTDLSSLSEAQQQQSFNLLTSESAALFDEILNDKQPSVNNDWEGISNDTFLPPNILKQSLGDAARGIGQKSMTSTDDKVSIKKPNR